MRTKDAFMRRLEVLWTNISQASQRDHRTTCTMHKSLKVEKKVGEMFKLDATEEIGQHVKYEEEVDGEGAAVFMDDTERAAVDDDNDNDEEDAAEADDKEEEEAEDDEEEEVEDVCPA